MNRAADVTAARTLRRAMRHRQGELRVVPLERMRHAERRHRMKADKRRPDNRESLLRHLWADYGPDGERLPC